MTTNPWEPYLNFWRLPWSGNVSGISPVTSWFSPDITVFAGDAQLETKINREIASYGKQLGIVSEAVIELSKGTPGEAVQKLEHMVAEIENAKIAHKNEAIDQAESTLAQLKEDDPQAFAKIMKRLSES